MWRRYLLLGATVIVVAIAAFAWHQARGPGKVVLPDDPDAVTLFSIDGTISGMARNKQANQELLYDYQVLGRVSIADVELRRHVVTAVKRDLEDDSDQAGYLCFFPRHVLRVVKGDRSIDVVICFECNRYRVYVGGKRVGDEDLPVGKNSRELLNRIFADAGIPLAP